jgi:hypothetical protein
MTFRRLLSYLTFPGIIAHEFAHAWACRRLGIRVEKVCYLRFGNPPGYVLHERPSSVLLHIMVAVAPFFVSTLLALAGSFTACILSASQLPPESRASAALLGLWFSFSLALHAFPSNGDAYALWDEVKNPQVGIFSKLLLLPVVGLIRLVQRGTCFWIDILFALAIVALPPVLLLVRSGT